MPKYQKRDFMAGRYYLSQRGESPAYYRTWLEGKQVKRVSLRTDNETEAKRL